MGKFAPGPELKGPKMYMNHLNNGIFGPQNVSLPQVQSLTGAHNFHEWFLVPMLTASGTYAVLRACVCMYVCMWWCMAMYSLRSEARNKGIQRPHFSFFRIWKDSLC